MNASHPVYTFANPSLAKPSLAKPTSANPTVAKPTSRPGMLTTQPTPYVQPNDNGLLITLSIILAVCIVFIGLAFSALLGM